MVTATWDAAVVAITMAGEEAAVITMVGGIIAIGGELTHPKTLKEAASIGGLYPPMNGQSPAPSSRECRRLRTIARRAGPAGRPS